MTIRNNAMQAFLHTRDENNILMEMLREYFAELSDIESGQRIDWGHAGNMAFFKEHLVEMLKFSRCLDDEEEAEAEIHKELQLRLHAAGA